MKFKDWWSVIVMVTAVVFICIAISVDPTATKDQLRSFVLPAIKQGAIWGIAFLVWAAILPELRLPGKCRQ